MKKICEEIITGFLRENDIELSYLKKNKITYYNFERG